MATYQTTHMNTRSIVLGAFCSPGYFHCVMPGGSL
jgi:hypothetical protein